MTLLANGLTAFETAFVGGDNHKYTVLSENVKGKFAGAGLLPYRMMNWNDAAEDLLKSILAQTPRPEREATEERLQQHAESIAEADGKNRVGVETVIQAWIESTPEPLREDLPRQLERFGLDPEDYRRLL